MPLDWNRLQVFAFVYRTGSILLAAKELHLTRSAVSQQLSKLEKELGAKLFERAHRKVRPTNAASRLYEIVHPFDSSLFLT